MRGKFLRRGATAAAGACLLLISSAGGFAVSATSGTLYVDASTTLAADHHGNIVIAANDVTLDCRGHRVLGPYAPEVSGGIEIGTWTNVTVRNCRVSGFAVNGLHADGAVNLRIEGSSFISNSNHGIHLHAVQGGAVIGTVTRDNAGVGVQFTAGNGTRVEDTTAKGNGAGFALSEGTTGVSIVDSTATDHWAGFVVDASPDNSLRGNVASSNEYGIILWSGANGTIVEANTVNRSTHVGILDEASGIELVDNSMDFNGAEGLVISGGITGVVATGNSAAGNLGSGFLVDLASECQIRDNTAANNAIAGFWFRAGADRNMVVHNTATGNVEGIVIEASNDNEFTSNVANNNDNTGFWIRDGASGNVLSTNIANGNAAIGFIVYTAWGNVLDQNVANNNDWLGFALNTASANTVTANQAKSNGGTGFDLIASHSNTITDNVSSNNGAGGYWLNHSSFNDLTGNVARNNGSVGYYPFLEANWNAFTRNVGCGNVYGDALDGATGNTWVDNTFCVASGL